MSSLAQPPVAQQTRALREHRQAGVSLIIATARQPVKHAERPVSTATAETNRRGGATLTAASLGQSPHALLRVPIIGQQGLESLIVVQTRSLANRAQHLADLATAELQKRSTVRRAAGSPAQTRRAHPSNAPVDSRRELRSLMIAMPKLPARHAQRLVISGMQEASRSSLVGLTIRSPAETLHAGQRVANLDILQELASLIIVPARRPRTHAQHPVRLDTAEPRRHTLARQTRQSLAQNPHASQSRAPLEHQPELASRTIVPARRPLRCAQHLAQPAIPESRKGSLVKLQISLVAELPHAEQTSAPLITPRELGSLMIVRARLLANNVRQAVRQVMMAALRHSHAKQTVHSPAATPHAHLNLAPLERQQELGSLIIARA
jgi:hypothetical protein